MPMPWTDQYIGIPFAFDGRDRAGCDCWGLVRLVYAEDLGIDLPEVKGRLTDHSTASLLRVARTIDQGLTDWVPVETPRPYDLVIFRKGRVNTHVGLVCGPGQMLHICEGIDAVVEPYAGLAWKNKIHGFYRYAK
jgi:cell wall-associated NlpC family hydrolase